VYYLYNIHQAYRISFGLSNGGNMNTKLMTKVGLLFLVVAMLFGFGARAVQAAEGTFDVTVAHNINGRSLGLSKDLPVNITIEKDGEVLAVISDFRFGDTISTALPAGTYLITVESVEAGPLPSMTVGPVELSEGLSLFLNARLSAGKTPIVSVVVR
jgi:hypothetical protein